MSRSRPQPFRPYHLADKPGRKFVAWVDLMGTRAMMDYSVPTTSTNICKFHASVLDSPKVDNTSIYPMMDGVYVIAESRDQVERFLREIYNGAAREMVERHETEDYHIMFTYVLKGVVTFGEVYEPEHIDPDGETVFKDSPYKEKLLLGRPIVRAAEVESDTPPFGITFHSSASGTGEDEVMEWWDDEDLPVDLRNLLEEYYDECEYRSGLAESNSKHLSYPKKKIREHRQEMREYLPQFRIPDVTVDTG